MNGNTQAPSASAKQTTASPARARSKKPCTQGSRSKTSNSKTLKAKQNHRISASDPFEREAREIGRAFIESRDNSLTDKNANIAPRRISKLSSNHIQSRTANSTLQSSIESVKGPGQPLHSTVRTEMERFFGKSLSHIRIHQGIQVNQILERTEANALTIDSKVFLHSRYSNLNSERTLELAAHEIAHSIQQSNVSGEIIQFDKDTPLYQILRMDKYKMEELVLNNHLVHVPALYSTYESWYTPVKEAVFNEALTTSERDNQINTAISLAHAASGKPGLALLADFLRLNGLYKFVIQILLSENDLPTLHTANPMFAHIESTEAFEKILSKSVTAGPHGKHFFPKIFQELITDYGRYPYYDCDLSMRHSERKGSNGKTLSEYAKEIYVAEGSLAKLGQNELKLYPLLRIDQEQDEVLKKLKEFDHQFFAPDFEKKEEIKITDVSLVSAHLTTIIGVKQEAERMMATKSAKPLSWVGNTFGKVILDAITPYVNFWEARKEEDEKRHQETDPLKSILKQDALGALYHSDPKAAAVADRYATGLLSRAKKFFVVDTSDISKQELVFENVPKQALTFLAYVDQITVRLMKAKAEAATGSAHEKMAGLLATALHHLHIDLYATTDAGLNKINKPFRIDTIIHKRIEVAADLLLIAAQFERNLPEKLGDEATEVTRPKTTVWKELKQVSKDAYNGNYLVKFAQLSMRNPFELDASGQDIDDFVKDLDHFKDSAIPFDISYAKDYYTLQYNKSVIRHLEDVVDEQKKIATSNKSIKQLWSFDQALDRVKEDASIHDLHRYKSENITWRQGDDDTVPFQYRVAEHRHFKDLKTKLKKDDRFALIKYVPLDPKDGSLHAIAWSIPNQGSFISPLRESDLLDGLVTLVRAKSSKFFEERTITQTDKRIPDSTYTALKDEEGILEKLFEQALVEGQDTSKNKDLGDLEWLGHLMKVNELRGFAYDHAEAVEYINEADLETSIEDRNRLTRIAVSTDRLIIGKQAKEGILTLLNMYVVNDPRTWKYVTRAIDYIRKFHNTIGKLEDKETQLALLMLEVADGLKHVYLDYSGWDGDAIYTYVSIAERVAQKGLPKKEKEYLFSKSELASKVSILTDTKNKIIGRLQDLQNNFGIRGYAGGPVRGQPGKGKQNLFESNISKATPVYAGDPTIARDPANEEEEESTKHGFFDLWGYSILLKHIEVDFTYFPPVGTQVGDALKAKDPNIAEDTYGRPPLLLKGTYKKVPTDPDEIAKNKFESDETVIAYVQIKVGEALSSEIPITAAQLYGKHLSLNWLSAVVHTKANLNNLENLKTVIETFNEVMMFALSVFPPTAIPAAIVEIGVMLAELKQNPEMLEEVKKALADPKEILDRVGTFFEDELDANTLFNILINGDFDLSSFIGDAGTHNKGAGKKKPKKGLGKVIANLRELGTVIALRVQSFRDKAQLPVQGLSNSIIARPLLARILNYLAHATDKTIPELLLDDPYIGPVYEFLYVHKDKIEALIAAPGQVKDFDLMSLQDQIKVLTDPVNDILSALTEFEFPEEVVPTEDLLEFLLLLTERLVLKFAKGKVKIAALAFSSVAHLGSLHGHIAEYLVPLLKELDLDPNLYWQRTIVPKFKIPVEDTINGFGTNLTKLVTETPILNSFIKADEIDKPSSEQIQVGTNSGHDKLFGSPSTAATLKQAEGGQVIGADVSASNEDSTLQSSSGNFDVNPALDPKQLGKPKAEPASKLYSNKAGTPLPRDIRSRAESNFGHNLGHVRLHQDSDSSRMNRAYGSHALTSGSHIFLNSGINPRQASGSSILYHEISHVLQNTGTTGRHQNPITSRSSNGLNLSYQREAGAEHMRKMAASPKVARVPIKGKQAPGFSPELDPKHFTTFLGKLTDFRQLPIRKEAIDKEGVPKKKEIEPYIETAERIWELFSNPILKEKDGPLKYADFLNHEEVRKELLPYLQENLKGYKRDNRSGVTKIVKVLAKKHARALPKKKNAPKNTPTKYVFGARAFLRDLETYYYTTTGVRIQIKKFDYKKASTAGGKPTIKSKGVGIEYLDLHLAESGKPYKHIKQLWALAIGKTFNDSGAPYKSNEAFNRRKGPAVDILSGIWSSTDSAQSNLNLWDSKKFKFSSTFKQKIDELLVKSKINKTQIPPWFAFMKATKEDTRSALDSVTEFKNDRNIYDQAGMHLSTHKYFKTRSNYSLGEIDRQSHHTTQYLLPEYFYCQKEGYKPFKDGLDYPGLSADKKTFRNLQEATMADISSDKIVQIEKTYRGSERGGAMPAILLSGYSHLNSKLHLAPEKDDEGNSSQGLKIHTLYQKHIPKELGPYVEQTVFEKYIQSLDGNLDKAKAKASAKIHKAIMLTYGDMRKHMKTGLIDHMPGKTIAYYKKVASDEDTDKDNFKRLAVKANGSPVTESDMRTDLVKRAKEVYMKTPEQANLPGVGQVSGSLNDHVMEALGWYWKE